jgi:glycerophosphoryl diester phosphodiesterase
MDIIAHRGASSLAPENTLLAIQKALDLGAPWMEIDVRLSKDRQVVVFHDDTLARMAKTSPQPVNALTYKELTRFDLGRGQKIPLLDEILSCINGRSNLIIEIKEKKMIAELAAVITRSAMAPHIAITSFMVSELAAIKRVLPAIPLSLDMEDDSFDTENIHKQYGIKEFSIDRHYATESWLVKQREKGFFTRIFTVDDPGEAKKYEQWGAGGIFTNKPQEFLKTINPQ